MGEEVAKALVAAGKLRDPTAKTISEDQFGDLFVSSFPLFEDGEGYC